MNDIIVPGEKVSDGGAAQAGTYVDNGSTYASVISLFREGKVIPLKGQYSPQPGDYVVGIVTVERFSGYIVDMHSPYEGTISSRDCREAFSVGDVLSAQVAEVNEVHEAVLLEPRKFTGGMIYEVSYVKVPRVIGRNGSMLELIKNHTGTEIFVGKNGRIYLRGGDINLARAALDKIDSEAHQAGLTDRMSAFLQDKKPL
jgi:exosome complex component RRP4